MKANPIPTSHGFILSSLATVKMDNHTFKNQVQCLSIMMPTGMFTINFYVKNNNNKNGITVRLTFSAKGSIFRCKWT